MTYMLPSLSRAMAMQTLLLRKTSIKTIEASVRTRDTTERTHTHTHIEHENTHFKP